MKQVDGLGPKNVNTQGSLEEAPAVQTKSNKRSRAGASPVEDARGGVDPKAYQKALGTDVPKSVTLASRKAQATRVQASAISSETAVASNRRLQEANEHFVAAKELRQRLVASVPTRTESNTLAPYNDIGIRLSAAYGAVGLLGSVHPDKAVRDAAEAIEQEIARFSTDMALDRRVYDAFTAVDETKLDVQAKRLRERVLRDYRRSGVDKDESTRERIRGLNEKLVVVGQEFDRNIREDVRSITLDSVADLAGLPDDYITAHPPGADGKIRITTDYPDYVPFMKYAKSESARRALTEQYRNRAYPQNDPVFATLLATRHELARALGYDTWAAYITEDKMIRRPDAAREFVDKVANIASPRAKAEYAELLAAKQKDFPGAQAVNLWEQGYYQEQVKQAKYAYDSQAVRPYFDYAKVKAGLLDLTSELFGLKFVPVKNADIWDPSVEAYDVADEKGSLGRIYLDMHPRDGKYKHAAHFPLKGGATGAQLTESVLVCNFPAPDPKTGVALMDHSDVTTFFHEFGHLLHAVLGGRQTWIDFSGVATERDFVEAPSQFFEEWAWDPKVLARFARHVETGEAIPAELVTKMKRASDYGEGLRAREQMFYAAMSLGYHDQAPDQFEPHALAAELARRYSMYPAMEGTHFENSFGHLNGYSAMYYTYMWSLVISKDLESGFEKNGLLDKDAARRYRDAILAPGGSKDAADLVTDFLGRPYSFDAFKKWIEGNLDTTPR